MASDEWAARAKQDEQEMELSEELNRREDPRPLRVLQLTIQHGTSHEIARKYKFLYDETTIRLRWGYFRWQVERPSEGSRDYSMECPCCRDLLKLRVYSFAESKRREQKGKLFRMLSVVAFAIFVPLMFVSYNVAVADIPPDGGIPKGLWDALFALSILGSIFSVPAFFAFHEIAKCCSLAALENTLFLESPFYSQPKIHLVTGIGGY